MHPSVIVLTKKIDNGILLLNDRDCAKKRRDRRDRGVKIAVIAFQEKYTFAENIRGEFRRRPDRARPPRKERS